MGLYFALEALRDETMHVLGISDLRQYAEDSDNSDIAAALIVATKALQATRERALSE